MYVGVDNVARKIKSTYVGVDGKARKVKAVYVGVNGVARLVWSSTFGKVKNYLSVKNANKYNVMSQVAYFGCSYFPETYSIIPSNKSKNIIYTEGFHTFSYSYTDTTWYYFIQKIVFDDSDNIIGSGFYNYAQTAQGHSYDLLCKFEFGDYLFNCITDTYDGNTTATTSLFDYSTGKKVFESNYFGRHCDGVAFNDNIAITTMENANSITLIKRNGTSISNTYITIPNSLSGYYPDYGLKIIKLSDTKGLVMGRAYSSYGGNEGIYAFGFKINSDENSVTFGTMQSYLSSSICNRFDMSKLIKIDETHAVFSSTYDMNNNSPENKFYNVTLIPVLVDDNLNVSFGSFVTIRDTAIRGNYYQKIGSGNTIGVATKNNYTLHLYDIDVKTNTIIDKGNVDPLTNNTGMTNPYWDNISTFKDNKIIYLKYSTDLNETTTYKNYDSTITPIIGEFSFE